MYSLVETEKIDKNTYNIPLYTFDAKQTNSIPKVSKKVNEVNVYHTCSFAAPFAAFGVVVSLEDLAVFLSRSENSSFERTIFRDGFPLLLPGNIKAANSNNKTSRNWPVVINQK